MKFNNLFQDPLSDSEAPYADTMILDGGGVDVRYGGETLAHVSFQDLDPFEVAFHAMPEDWEPHKEYDEETETLLYVSHEDIVENQIYRMLDVLGKLRGWERK